MSTKLKDFCLTFALLVYTAVPSGIAIADPAFRPAYADIVKLSLSALIGSLSKSKQAVLPKGKTNKRIDE
jgi:hypothetical protein